MTDGRPVRRGGGSRQRRRQRSEAPPQPLQARRLRLNIVAEPTAENSFLTDEHTTARYMTEMWIPGMFERSDLGLWRDQGAVHLRERIKDRLSDLLH